MNFQRGRSQEEPEINLIPMIDVLLVLLTAQGEHLPAGSLIEYENGIATRYDDVRHWLANWASLFGSMRAQ